jgi:hypothetical protein
MFLAAAAGLAALAVPVRAQVAPEEAASQMATRLQAEARSAAKDWAAAAALWEKVTAADPVDGRAWGQLGAARLRAGRPDAAVEAFRHAMASGGVGAPVNLYNIACARAVGGDRKGALDALEAAFTAGFPRIDAARNDPDLQALHGDPRFEALLPVAPTGLSREAGWRLDLDFLARQIDRIGAAPYRKHPKAWFDAQFAALAASAPSRTDTQMEVALARIMAQLGDGHSGVMGAVSLDWALGLPVQFLPFQDGLFITAADPAHRDLVGSQVLTFGGKPVQEVLAAVAETVPRDNEGGWIALQAAYRLRKTALLQASGLTADARGASLGLRDPSGQARTVEVPADTAHPDIWNEQPNPAGWVNVADGLSTPPPYLRNRDKPYWFEDLPDRRTLYFGFNQVRDGKDESLAQFSQRLTRHLAEHHDDRLIVDLRWNNGGNINLLTPLLAALIRSERVDQRGRLFVIIGPRTFSAAQNAATLMERFANATFVGEPSGSSPNFVGEEIPFTLPYSKLVVNVSPYAWQPGLPTDLRTWIAPALYTPATFAALRAGRDPAVEAILALPIPPAA